MSERAGVQIEALAEVSLEGFAEAVYQEAEINGRVWATSVGRACSRACWTV